jgi:hypothetical protein
MTKIELGTITASAMALSQLAGGTGHTGFAWVRSDVSNINAATLKTGVEKIEIPDSARTGPVQLPVQAAGIDRWTKTEKIRYRKLLVKFASSVLSDAEQKEFRELELARTRFEDPRTSKEIIAEFRIRRLYADLNASLMNVSTGLRR